VNTASLTFQYFYFFYNRWNRFDVYQSNQIANSPNTNVCWTDKETTSFHRIFIIVIDGRQQQWYIKWRWKKWSTSSARERSVQHC